MNLNFLSLFSSNDSQLVRHGTAKLEAADFLALRLRVIALVLIQVPHHHQNAQHEQQNDQNRVEVQRRYRDLLDLLERLEDFVVVRRELQCVS